MDTADQTPKTGEGAQNTENQNTSLFAPAGTAPATEPTETQPEETTTKPVDEMTEEEKVAAEKKALRERAKMMGLNPSPNAGVDTLRAMIKAKIDGETPAEPAQTETQTEPAPAPTTQVNPLAEATTAPVNKSREQAAAQAIHAADTSGRPLTKMERRQIALADAMRLVRVRISNLDPKKKDLPGEILTVANGVIGTVKKFIPYGEATDDGFHIPNILYQHLKERTFSQIRQVRDKRTGTNRTETRDVREFSIEVLEPLTQAELDQLAQAQIAAGSID